MIKKGQYLVLSFFLTRSLFMVGIYSLLINMVQSNVLLVCLLGMLLGYFFLFLFYKKKMINNYLLVGISSIILITLITANTVLNNTYLLFKTPPLLIMISFILLGMYGASKGMENVSRTGFIIGWISFITFILAIFGLIGVAKFSNLLPFLKEDFFKVIKGILIFSSTSLLPNLLLINYKSNLKFRDISKGYILGCLSIILFMFYIIGIFGYELSSIVRFPEYLILKKINIGGFTNIENVLVMELIATLMVSGIICMKVLKDNTNKYFYIGIILMIMLGMEFLIFNSNYVNVLYIKKYSYYVFIFFILASLLMKTKKSS